MNRGTIGKTTGGFPHKTHPIPLDSSQSCASGICFPSRASKYLMRMALGDKKGSKYLLRRYLDHPWGFPPTKRIGVRAKVFQAWTCGTAGCLWTSRSGWAPPGAPGAGRAGEVMRAKPPAWSVGGGRAFCCGPPSKGKIKLSPPKTKQRPFFLMFAACWPGLDVSKGM